MQVVLKKDDDLKKRQSAVLRARFALGYFALVAVLGLFLRWQMVDPVPGLNFKNFLHAHSHVALLGWLYCAFFAALLYAFPSVGHAQKKLFNRQFMLTQVAVLGMLFTFPVQGYGLFPIFFSTMHILLSYWFSWTFWKQVKQDKLIWQKYRTALRFVGFSLLLLVISSAGPWAMGPIMASGVVGSKLYYSAIYFYLHFQYNGWFTFALLGLFFWLLDKKRIPYNRGLAKQVFVLLAIASVLTVILSLLWTKPAMIWFWIGGIGGLLQLVGLSLFLKLLWDIRKELAAQLFPWVKGLFALSLLSLSIKVSLQFASAFPAVAQLAYQVRYFIIGYLHLSLIGFVSTFLIAFFLQQRLYILEMQSKIGLILLLLFFFLTEALMFLQGTFLWLRLPIIPEFNLLMFLLSIGMPVGLLLFFMSQPGLTNSVKK